jgi:hypothetical protein
VRIQGKELPSRPANLSCPGALLSAARLYPLFGIDRNGFNSQGDYRPGPLAAAGIVFGAAYAPWSPGHRACVHMETAPVQSAGVAAPTPPASPGLDGVQASGGSFAVTLDRALETARPPTQSVPSSDPKVTQREKSTTADRSAGDAFAQAGLLVSCPSFVQSPPTLATGASKDELTADPKAPAVADMSASEAIARLSDGQASESASTASTRAALASVAALNAFSGIVAQTLGAAGATSLDAPNPGGDSGQLPTNALSRPACTPLSPPDDSAPARTWEIQELSAAAMAVGEGATGVSSLAATKDLQTSSHPAPNLGSETSSTAVLPVLRLKEQRPAPAEGSTQPTTQSLLTWASVSLFSTQPQPPGPVQAQGATQPQATQRLQAALISIPLSTPPTQTARASAEETTKPAHADLAEVSSLLAEFPGAKVSLSVAGPESESAGSETEPTSVATDPAKASPAAPVSPNSDGSVNDPAKGSAHTEAVFSPTTPADASQKTWESEPASLLGAPPSTVTSAPTQHLDTGPRPVTSDSGLREGTAVEANAVQPPGGSPSASNRRAASGDPSDHAANGDAKPGQGGGSLGGENPPADKPLTLDLTSRAAADPTANLLAAHAPESPVSHADTSTAQTLPPAGQPPTTLAAWQNYQGSTGGIVRSAQLSDHAGGAEMHVELRSGLLGPLEVHAVVREGSVGAEIHVEGHDAHSALAASLPSLQQALGERNLRVDSIAVYRDYVGGGMSGGERQGAHSSPSYSAQPQVVRWDSASRPRPPADGTQGIEVGEDSAVGLNVCA